MTGERSLTCWNTAKRQESVKSLIETEDFWLKVIVFDNF